MKKYLFFVFLFEMFYVGAQTNNPPVLTNPFDDISVYEDDELHFVFPDDLFTDPDTNDAVVYDAQVSDGTSLPEWLKFDGDLHTFSGVPSNDDVGVLSVQIIATDMSGESGVFDFKIEVVNTNDPPFVQGSIDDIRIKEDEAFEYIFPEDLFGDVDVNDVLSYSAVLPNGTALPAWLIFDGTKRSFSGNPDNDAVGSLEVELTASDIEGESVSIRFFVDVENVNDPPTVVNTIPEQKVELNSEFSYTIPNNIFEDVDFDDHLTLSSTLADGSSLPDWLTFDSTDNSFSGVPTEVNEYVLKITATDLSGDTVSTGFKLRVYQTTGMEPYSLNDFKVYPNPSHGAFFVELNNLNAGESSFLIIRDISGKIIWKEQFNTVKKEVKPDNISSGMYFIEVKNNKQQIIKKILIK